MDENGDILDIISEYLEEDYSQYEYIIFENHNMKEYLDELYGIVGYMDRVPERQEKDKIYLEEFAKKGYVIID